MPTHPSPDIDSLWDYNQPAETATRFQALLASSDISQPEYRFELTTQLARTHSLRRQFAEAHAVLDQLVPQLEQMSSRAQARYWLERGRTYNSAGERSQAIEQFEKAWLAAQRAQADFYAIDALHMLAIATQGETSLQWGRQGLAVAQRSGEKRAQDWASRLWHNLGMTYHSMGDYPHALQAFEAALPLWRSQGLKQREFEGRWMVGWTLRSMQRHQEALAMMHILRAEMEATDQPDGYVYEELGENLMALQQPDAATPWFAKAYALLKDDPDVRAEPARLDRLRQLSGR
ncbi:tetratricopeptide (TPR) repeat protein [Chitinivorax tropicus]|uniref:Tetratricopeptide (TPR) repeat protein n=1 Tax=Chitinivorax tropicus TaxID=714531 RepID=A0A840MVK2_9PROT|nr:tetratricopeptide repeat protein [Chitinivorax tropicus]MBB5019201.1 tetratricopeptide (TPR) repeat protein [Chitinivorax tropicus]